jgi:hypothetical protein
MTERDAEAELHCITLAIHYYAMGRAAAAFHLIPLAGNLLHHSVEMSIKGLLVTKLGLAKLRKISHNLEELWTAAIATQRAMDSETRRETIEQLHRFEAIRYPDNILTHGAAIHVNWTGLPRVGSSLTVPVYNLVIEHVDEIFRAVFKATGKNPQFFLPSLSEDARNAMAYRNRNPFW